MQSLPINFCCGLQPMEGEARGVARVHMWVVNSHQGDAAEALRHRHHQAQPARYPNVFSGPSLSKKLCRNSAPMLQAGPALPCPLPAVGAGPAALACRGPPPPSAFGRRQEAGPAGSQPSYQLTGRPGATDVTASAWACGQEPNRDTHAQCGGWLLAHGQQGSALQGRPSTAHAPLTCRSASACCGDTASGDGARLSVPAGKCSSNMRVISDACLPVPPPFSERGDGLQDAACLPPAGCWGHALQKQSPHR